MKLENIFIQVPTAIFWKDTHSIYLGCNLPQAIDAGLYLPEEIVGKSDYDMVWAEFADLYRRGDEEVLDRATKVNLVETQKRPNNQYVTIRVNKAPLRDVDGNVIGVIGICTDVSDSRYKGAADIAKKNIALTYRQTDCLVKWVQGMTAKQIGESLNISKRTVEHHIERIKNLLSCESKTELIKKALSLEIVKARLFDE